MFVHRYPINENALIASDVSMVLSLEDYDEIGRFFEGFALAQD